MGSPVLFFVEKSRSASVRSGVAPHHPVSAFYATPAKKTETGGILMYHCVGVVSIPQALPLPLPDITMNTRKGVYVSYVPAEKAG